MPAELSPEDRLCLLLARGELLPAQKARVSALLDTPLSWDRILERATAHAVYPLLYRSLRMLGFYGVPAGARDELEARYRANALHATLLAQELARVLRTFQAAGIPAIPLKGVALAEALYGDPASRVSADMDILVPRPMVRRTFGVLLADGYEHAEPHPVAVAELEFLLDSNIEYRFARRGGLYPLELHWDLVWGWQPSGLTTEKLWAEAHPKVVFGVPAHALSPEWELLYLAAHAAFPFHRWGLKWLVDLHEVCSRAEVDWEKVNVRAARLGWQQVLRLALGACHALLDTPVPAHFVPRVLPTWLTLFPAGPPPSEPLRDALFCARVLGRPRGQLRYLARLWLQPTLAERRLVRLPAWLGLLYYPLRPGRLLCRGAWALLRAWVDRLRRLRLGQPR